jgi:hypothetical protein
MVLAFTQGTIDALLYLVLKMEANIRGGINKDKSR